MVQRGASQLGLFCERVSLRYTCSRSHPAYQAMHMDAFVSLTCNPKVPLGIVLLYDVDLMEGRRAKPTQTPCLHSHPNVVFRISPLVSELVPLKSGEQVGSPWRVGKARKPQSMISSTLSASHLRSSHSYDVLGESSAQVDEFEEELQGRRNDVGYERRATGIDIAGTRIWQYLKYFGLDFISNDAAARTIAFPSTHDRLSLCQIMVLNTLRSSQSAPQAHSRCL